MKTSIVLLIASLSLAPSVVRSEIKFFDDFESGGLYSTNSDGFVWYNPTSTGTMVANDGAGTAVSGIYSLRARYPAGEYWREKRFDMGVPYRDLWVSYWLRVPSNFTHGTASPNNAKLACFWMGTYDTSSTGPTVCWERWNDGSGGSRVTCYLAGFGHQQSTQFITIPADRGRWMQLVFNIKAATDSTSNDGHLKMWRRWSNESSFTQIHNVLNLNMPSKAGYPNGWKQGYLNGYANAAYAEQTDWYIDDFTISTTSLLDSGNEEISPPTGLIFLKNP